MYRVAWKRGQPFIDVGEIVIVGKKNIQKIKWKSDQKVKPLSTGYPSIVKAIEQDIFDTAFWFGKVVFTVDNKHKDAWLLASCINRLIRLRRKLEKHNLFK